MSFLSDLHYSIISGRFYENVSERPAGEIARFIALVCLLTALISGVAHTYYSFDPARGIPRELVALFTGMEFKNGALNPRDAAPSGQRKGHAEKLLNLFFCVSNYFSDLPDSALVIDTSENALSRKKMVTKVLLARHSFNINRGPEIGPPVSYTIPYSSIVRDGENTVTEESVGAALKKNLFTLSAIFIMHTFMATTLVFLLSIAFLTFAAYIFRLERERKFGEFLKIACFAASPVYVGTNLVALSGTMFFWTWHAMILIATFAMFRGVMASRKNTDRPVIND